MDKILIVKMSALGDVVMTLPAVSALRRKYPEAEIDWVVEPPSAGILEGNRDINRVLVSPRHRVEGLARRGRLFQAWRMFKAYKNELRSVDYDVVLDLQGLFKSGVQVVMARASRKVGFDRTREKSYVVLNEKIPPYDPERHALLRYLDAAVYLGADWPESLPEHYYQVLPEAEKEAAELLGSGQSPYVVLNPGAKWLTKRWPQSHWEQLASRLARETDYRLVITGGNGDIRAGRGIAEAAGETAIDLCGKTSLPVLAAVLAGARAVVTADTGPMHLAAAVGARGVAIFGPTKPGRTGPFGGDFKIVQPDLDCLGCLKKSCPRPCLETLSCDTVWQELLPLLKE